MSVCPGCNSEVKDAAKFCPSCGVALTTESAGGPPDAGPRPVEREIMRGPANMRRGGWERVGGHLRLTDAQLEFVPHAFNLQGGAQSWPLTDVTEADLFNDLGIVPNALKVRFADDTDAIFNLTGREKWRTAILAAARGARVASGTEG